MIIKEKCLVRLITSDRIEDDNKLLIVMNINDSICDFYNHLSSENINNLEYIMDLNFLSTNGFKMFSITIEEYNDSLKTKNIVEGFKRRLNI